MNRLLAWPAHLYDWHLGWMLGRRFLRLTHIGRVSGRRYQTVLEVIGRGRSEDEVVVMAGRGQRADWLLNLQATPGVEVAISRVRFVPEHRILDPDEASSVLAGYEEQHPILAPVVRSVLSRLVGWRYDGSTEARRRLLTVLPLVALRPRPSR